MRKKVTVNRFEAAAILGVSLRTFYRIRYRYSLIASTDPHGTVCFSKSDMIAIKKELAKEQRVAKKATKEYRAIKKGIILNPVGAKNN